MTGIQDHFRGSVPPGYDVLRQRRGRLFVASRKTKIADLKVTIFIEQEIGWLQISMDDVGRVNVETASKQLIHEILDVVISKILARVDDSMHVRLHQICNDIDIFEAGLGGRLCHID